MLEIESKKTAVCGCNIAAEQRRGVCVAKSHTNSCTKLLYFSMLRLRIS